MRLETFSPWQCEVLACQKLAVRKPISPRCRSGPGLQFIAPNSSLGSYGMGEFNQRRPLESTGLPVPLSFRKFPHE